ncbi:MAG: hypothetical protein JXQ96_13085 [Cyclobacteriaceae bacterium]
MEIRLLTLFLFASSLSIAQKQYDPICWTGVKCLKVSDFRGNAVVDSISAIIGGKKPAGLSSLPIEHHIVEYDTINLYRLVGYFERDLSWLDEDGALLSHEQTHFNIQQLVIRRTNKLLDSIFYNAGTKINYDSLFNEIMISLDSLNQRLTQKLGME